MSNTVLENAHNLRLEGKLPQAAQLYHELLRANPKHLEALKALGRLYFDAGQSERANYLFDEAVKIDPFDLDTLCLHGITLMQLTRREEAIARFDRALALNADFVHALVNRGTAFQEMGRYEEALADFNAALKLGTHAGAWNNLGTTYVAMSRFAEAVSCYDQALELAPDFALARDNRRKALEHAHQHNAVSDVARYLCARGTDFMHQRRFPEALTHFDEALILEPGMIEAISNRATSLLQMGNLEDAVASFDKAVALAPSHAISWNNRGNALVALGRAEEAVASYDKALELQPDLQQAIENRANALFYLKRLDRCPPDFMRRLFDDFSSHYDATMLEKLHYRAHLDLRTLAGRVVPALDAPLRILDLGSGTGLVGEAFKDLAVGGQLDGIDLSPRMIDAARARGLYDGLILGDVEIVLNTDGPSYDLILAADTMIYIGDLDKVFSGVAKRLRPGGFYIFAVESKDGEGWEHTQTNRFRHSAQYLREAAAKAGLDLVETGDCTLRVESGVAVSGFTVALKKPDAQTT